LVEDYRIVFPIGLSVPESCSNRGRLAGKKKNRVALFDDTFVKCHHYAAEHRPLDKRVAQLSIRSGIFITSEI